MHSSDSTLSSGLGGGGDNGPFYATFEGRRGPRGIDGSGLVSTKRPGSDALARPEVISTKRPGSDALARPEVISTKRPGTADHPIIGSTNDNVVDLPIIGSTSGHVADVPVLGSGLGGGGNQNFY